MEQPSTNATTSSSLVAPVVPIPSDTSLGNTVLKIGVFMMFTFGIPGNLLALFILHRTRSSSNQKHGFMLRCLATNDCIALTGMLVHTTVSIYWPTARRNVWSCRIKVLLRTFGLGSGCIAFVMAFERWLALTRPFFYQKHISLCLLKRMTVILWLGVLCLTCAPFFGFGIYWEQEKSKCVQYRNAKQPLDVFYVYTNLIYGVFLCFAIVYTNLAVMKALCMKSSPHNKHNVIIRRTTRGSSLTCNAATKEERAFGWLMICLCVAFFICWVPKMISIPLSLFVSSEKMYPLSITTDYLLAMHLALDPYMYVLHHWTLVKSVCMRQQNKENPNSRGASVIHSSSRTTSSRTT